MLCPRCSGKLIETLPTCPTCGWVRPRRTIVAPKQPPSAPLTNESVWADEGRSRWTGHTDAPINNSGTGAPPPAEVRSLGYCWGGLAFPFWFSICNNIALGCIFHGLLMGLWLGQNGHEAAWRHRRFRDFQHFRDEMRGWDTCGKFWVLVGLGVLMCWVLMPLGARIAQAWVKY